MATTEIKLPDEFASTMQQLVAEAARTHPPEEPGSAADSAQLEAIQARLEQLERTITEGFAKTATAQDEQDVEQMARIDENLRALRNTERVNQRLFDSLHEELKMYRDNFLRETLQKPLIRDLVHLHDDLNALKRDFDAVCGNEKSIKQTRCRTNLQNTIHFVTEMMNRIEVVPMEEVEKVDRALHRVVSFEPTTNEAEDGKIVRQTKPGFCWHGKILRPQEVVAKRFVADGTDPAK